MILLDPRMGGGDKAKQKERLDKWVDCFKRAGLKTEVYTLPFGDAAFEGKGPKGDISIGVERKTLHDMLHCIDDAHYSALQRTGMSKLYQANFLIVEGCFRPHDPNGILMEGFNGGQSWGECRYRSQKVMYSKLYRYLLSVSLSGVHVIYSRDMYQTAFDIGEVWHYFQKPWHKHTSMMETQKLNIPCLSGRPNLVRRWASEIDAIGVVRSDAAAKQFKSAYDLAQADEGDWMRLPGVGAATARKIVREIHGIK